MITNRRSDVVHGFFWNSDVRLVDISTHIGKTIFLDCYGKWEYSAAAYIKICITAIHTFEYGRA